MSWFRPPERFESSLPVDDEPMPEGVRIERRRLLQVSGLGLAAWMASSAGRANGAVVAEDDELDSALESLTFSEFLEKASPLARELIRSKKPNEEAYLYQVASWLSRLQPSPTNPFANQKRSRPIQMHSVGGSRPIAVVQIKLEPGASIPFHDHRNYNGVILGLEGVVRCRNYDFFTEEGEEHDPEGPLLIQKTQDTTLAPGRFSTLSTKRDNIHDLRAGENGARVLDVFTYFPDSEGSHYLEVNEDAVDSERGIYEADWK